MICQESVYMLFGIWAFLHIVTHTICFSIFKVERQFYTVAITYAFDIIYMSLWFVILNYFSKRCTVQEMLLLCEKQVYVIFIILFVMHMVLYALGWALFKMENQFIVIGVLVFFDIVFLVSFPLLLNLFSGVCPV